MAQPTFFLQPLAAAISLACFSSVVFAAEADSAHILAPIVVTAQQGNDAHGLIVHADPKQPTQPIPAVDGAAYLQSIVGFNQIKNGGANGDVTFRGMFGSRIKILTDGTENLGACPSRMDNPASYVSPESYDKITVVKGPQTVQYAHTGSAATVIFEREPEQLTSAKPYRGQASVMLGSYGRLDQNVEAAVGDETKYARLNANRSIADSYQDGAGNTVPSDWEKWNADLALGWTPNEDTWVELKGGKSDGEAVYAGRSMDGSKFARESLGLHVEKKNIGDVIKKVEAQVDYSYNDHVMDNFSLRKFNPADGMSMPMASNVARRTLNARVAMTQDWGNCNLFQVLIVKKMSILNVVAA
jgi:iron complex outermembrane receptor protein